VAGLPKRTQITPNFIQSRTLTLVNSRRIGQNQRKLKDARQNLSIGILIDKQGSFDCHRSSFLFMNLNLFSFDFSDIATGPRSPTFFEDRFEQKEPHTLPLKLKREAAGEVFFRISTYLLSPK
jgi:hypothetical protein